VEKAVKAVDATATLTFDMTERQVAVTSSAGNEVLQAALKDAGFMAAPL
jgi:hypothetical protein